MTVRAIVFEVWLLASWASIRLSIYRCICVHLSLYLLDLCLSEDRIGSMCVVQTIVLRKEAPHPIFVRHQ